MICFMHQGSPYGYLRIKDSNGGYTIPDETRLAKMTGNMPDEMYEHEHPGHLEEARKDTEEALKRQLERVRRREMIDADEIDKD